MEEDLVKKRYFSDNERFADLIRKKPAIQSFLPLLKSNHCAVRPRPNFLRVFRPSRPDMDLHTTG